MDFNEDIPNKKNLRKQAHPIPRILKNDFSLQFSGKTKNL